jgi:hypothetical protein
MRPYRPWTLAERRALTRLWASGTPTDELTARFGRSACDLRAMASHLGARRPPGFVPRPSTTETKPKVDGPAVTPQLEAFLRRVESIARAFGSAGLSRRQVLRLVDAALEDSRSRGRTG